jgi:hypothetical protein
MAQRRYFCRLRRLPTGFTFRRLLPHNPRPLAMLMPNGFNVHTWQSESPKTMKIQVRVQTRGVKFSSLLRVRLGNQ